MYTYVTIAIFLKQTRVFVFKLLSGYFKIYPRDFSGKQASSGLVIRESGFKIRYWVVGLKSCPVARFSILPLYTLSLQLLNPNTIVPLPIKRKGFSEREVHIHNERKEKQECKEFKRREEEGVKESFFI